MNIYIKYNISDITEIISEDDWNKLEADWMRDDYLKMEVPDKQGKHWLENYDEFFKIQNLLEKLS